MRFKFSHRRTRSSLLGEIPKSAPKGQRWRNDNVRLTTRVTSFSQLDSHRSETQDLQMKVNTRSATALNNESRYDTK